MRLSRLFAPTLREEPVEAEIASHRLMLRAGLIRKVAAGLYSCLPLGQRVRNKVINIIRQEMDAKGGQEILMPAIQPAELWKKTGRWDEYGNEMMKLKDRTGREFCLGPTHEELVVTLLKNEIRSYRQLPLLVYQIQTKYRDEIRPRFGVMRVREFTMKDLYSFDATDAGLDESYRKMYDAYTRIFKRCGLNFRAVEADPGLIGGNESHEFMAIAPVGENTIVYCSNCGYASNMVTAKCAYAANRAQHAPTSADSAEQVSIGQPSEVHTPNIKTVEQLTGFLKRQPQEVIKTLIYLIDGEPVVVLVRGDHELNELKLKNLLGSRELMLGDRETIEELTKAPVGFAGPIGLDNYKIVADYAVGAMRNTITGANKRDKHLVNVNPDRDFTIDLMGDIRVVQKGDSCISCGSALELSQGIEVGQIFKLGTKYSEPLQGLFAAESGNLEAVTMGCYGIGVERTIAAVIEQHHDEKGIIWPISVAPYQVIITTVDFDEPLEHELAEKIYQGLQERAIEALLDDRSERPGVKFNDAELIGIPIQVVVGPKCLSRGKLEVKLRAAPDERTMVQADEIVEHISQLVQTMLAVLRP